MGSKDKRQTGEAPAKTFKNNPFASLLGSDAENSKEGKAPEVVATEAAPPQVAAQAAKAEAPLARPHKSRGRLVLRRETKHRAGRAAIVISGFSELRDFDARATDALAKELKQLLGCGGTVEVTNGVREVVLQGDKAAKVAELLRARGFRVDGVTS